MNGVGIPKAAVVVVIVACVCGVCDNNEDVALTAGGITGCVGDACDDDDEKPVASSGIAKVAVVVVIVVCDCGVCADDDEEPMAASVIPEVAGVFAARNAGGSDCDLRLAACLCDLSATFFRLLINDLKTTTIDVFIVC